MVQRGFVVKKSPATIAAAADMTENNSLRNVSTSDGEASLRTAAAKLKTKPSNDMKAKRNLTLMIISTSLLFSFGTLPWAVYYTLLNVIQVNFPFMSTLQIVARCCLYSFIASKIFVYYFSNRLYRQVLQRYFKTIFGCLPFCRRN